MRPANFYQRILFVALLCLIASCREDIEPIPNPEPEPDPQPSYVEYSGKIKLDAEEVVEFDKLEIVSGVESQGIDKDGSFRVESVENEMFQLYFLSSKENDETVYLGINEPGSNEVVVSDSTTAIGLLLINPILLSTSQDQREEFIFKAIKNDNFPMLIQELKKDRQQRNSITVDINQNPAVVQYLLDITDETIQYLASKEASMQEQKYWSTSIEIEDGPSRKIKFRNWRHAYYGAEIVNTTTSETSHKRLDRIRNHWYWKWEWFKLPKRKLTKGVYTYQDVSDGRLLITARKLDFDKFLQMDHAFGEATTWNIATAVYYCLDILLGINDLEVGDFVAHLILQNSRGMSDMKNAYEKGDALGMLEATVELLKANALTIVDNQDYASKAGKFWKFALKVYSFSQYAKEHIPFFYDLVRGPNEVQFRAIQENGRLQEYTKKQPPAAKLICSPAIGYKETDFTLRATEYEDDWTVDSLLMFRWKVGNGVWTEYSLTDSLEITLSEEEQVWLEVKDEDGLTTMVSQDLQFYEAVNRTRIVFFGSHVQERYRDYFTSIGFDNTGDLEHVITGIRENSEYGIEEFDISTLNTSTDLLYFSTINGDDGQAVVELWEKEYLSIQNFARKGGAILMEINHGSTFTGDDYWSTEVRPFSIQMRDAPYNRIIQKYSSSGDYHDFIGPLGYWISGNGWVEGKELQLSHHAYFSDFSEDEGQVHLINEYGVPILVQRNQGFGTYMGMITSPIATEESRSVTTQAIKYLVEK